MSVLLLPPIFQFFDNNGDPLANGFIDTFAAGTTTRLATYTDSTGTIAAPNPIQLNAAGRPTSGSGAIWGQGACKFIVRDANGVQVGDVLDNVISFNSLAAATNAYAETFSGNGVQTVFTASSDLGTDPKALLVSTASGLQNVILNGDFATDTIWTKGAGWTIGAGVATAAGAISTAITQVPAITVIPGQAYAVTYTITRSAGGLIPTIGSQGGVERTASGTYREIIIAGSSTPIGFTGNAFTGTLDNVTVTVATNQNMTLLPSNAYTVNGTSITFATPPALGTNNIDVRAPSLLLGAASSAAALAQLYAANALTSETNAATSATSAATSATNASNSATAAAASFDSFDDRYLGAKAADPTLDNDGNALIIGALYFNTVSNVMKAWNGTSWQVSYNPSASDMFKSVYDPANVNEQLVGLTATQAMSNKILTLPTINTGIIGDVATKTFNARLTLTSGLPVTTADVTAASTIYLTPYKGREVSVYSGSSWVLLPFTQLSLALSGLTASRPYDVYLEYNAGSPILSVLAWTNDTTRATALVLQDGVYVKSGTPAHRYVGTVYTTGTTTTEDSAANRYVWNYYNRVERSAIITDATVSWAYSTAAFREANGSTANRFKFLIGVAEDAVNMTAINAVLNSTATVRAVGAGIGLDSTTVTSAKSTPNIVSSAGTIGIFSKYDGVPSAGFHYLSWLEFGAGTDTQTWFGSATRGLTGSVKA